MATTTRRAVKRPATKTATATPAAKRAPARKAPAVAPVATFTDVPSEPTTPEVVETAPTRKDHALMTFVMEEDKIPTVSGLGRTPLPNQFTEHVASLLDENGLPSTTRALSFVPSGEDFAGVLDPEHPAIQRVFRQLRAAGKLNGVTIVPRAFTETDEAGAERLRIRYWAVPKRTRRSKSDENGETPEE